LPIKKVQHDTFSYRFGSPTGKIGGLEQNHYLQPLATSPAEKQLGSNVAQLL
jgi:hypothetical protein